MCNWIKSVFKDYKAAQNEIAKENVFYIATWYGMTYYIIPEKYDNDENDKDTMV
jgi:hypothetical protein